MPRSRTASPTTSVPTSPVATPDTVVLTVSQHSTAPTPIVPTTQVPRIQGECSKFDGKAFHQWKKEVQDYLFINGVWQNIERGPTPVTTETELRLASYLLRQALSQSIKAEFPSCDTAYDLYHAVLNRYQGRESSNANALRDQLSETIFLPSMTMLKYTTSLSNIFEQLSQAGEPLARELQVQYLI